MLNRTPIFCLSILLLIPVSGCSSSRSDDIKSKMAAKDAELAQFEKDHQTTEPTEHAQPQ